MRAGRLMLVGSIISRLGVVALLCALALMTSYVNLKQAYNNPRLVELSLGATARKAYEVGDAVLSIGMDPELQKGRMEQVAEGAEKAGRDPADIGIEATVTIIDRPLEEVVEEIEGWRALGINGAQIVFNPSATSRGLSSYLWQLEQPASAVANMYYIGAINRVGIEDLGDNDFYGTTYFVDPRGQYVGDVCSDQDPELIVRDLDLDRIDEVRNQWAFYRDRRPDMYDGLVAP